MLAEPFYQRELVAEMLGALPNLGRDLGRDLGFLLFFCELRERARVAERECVWVGWAYLVARGLRVAVR